MRLFSSLGLVVVMQSSARVYFSGRRRQRELAPEEADDLAHPWKEGVYAGALLLFGLLGQAALVAWSLWRRG